MAATHLAWGGAAFAASQPTARTPQGYTVPSDRVAVVKDMQPSRNLGNTLDAMMWQGNRKLTQGRDYTVSGDRVTLTATALTRLAGDRAYGVNSTIQLRFDSGLAWPVHICTYDTPVLSNASGTSSGLVVPTGGRRPERQCLRAVFGLDDAWGDLGHDQAADDHRENAGGLDELGEQVGGEGRQDHDQVAQQGIGQAAPQVHVHPCDRQ